ncbi:MAG: SusC/RagA family TonB-linked outer membrane protein [Bacteroidota bacterium]
MKKILTKLKLCQANCHQVFCCLLITFFLSTAAAFAQETTITGKVIEESNEGLPGVNIQVKGTTNGTVTDANGEYSLKVSQPNAVLVFSYVGFLPQEVALANQSKINVTLVEDTKNLEEVVVTALGIKKETRTIGYSTQEVKGQELIKAREPNAINSLVGKVAGLTVAPSAELLGRPQLVLRGSSNLLFVVDGVPVNSDTWNVSADDIESYTVLKGANASALYGFRGQNGAILITTKRGSKDKRGFSVEFNSSTMMDNGFLTLPKNQAEYGAGSNYNYRFGDGPYDDTGTGGTDQRPNVWGPRFEGQDVRQYNSPVGPDGKRIGTPWTAKGVDNYQKFMEVGILSNNNVSISASNEKSDMRISLSHSYQKGIAPNTRLQITNFNISAGHNFSSKIRLEGNINFNRQYTPNIPDVNYGPNSYTYMFKVYGSQHWDVNDMQDYYKLPQNAVGAPGVRQYFFEYGRNNNPYFMSYEWLRGHYKTDVYGYAKLNYKVTDYLDISLRTQVSTWNMFRNEKLPFSAIIYGRDFREGDYREEKRALFENNTDLLIKFDKDISPAFHLTAVAGANLRSFQYKSGWESTDYLIVPGVYNLSNSKNPKLAYNYESDMLVYSAYGSIDLSYKKFITLSATGREDKLSTLDKNNNSFFYPSLSLSTVVSDYVKLPGFISFMKLRGSYANVKGGLTSSTIAPSWFGAPSNPSPVNPLQYGSTYYTSYDGPNYENQSYYSIKNLYNNTPSADYTSILPKPGLKAFTVSSYEAGVDLKFLQNRLGLDVTYFNTEDGPNIVRLPVASSTGYSRRIENDLVTKKTGWEVALNGAILKNPDGLNWDVTANWSMFREKVSKINDPAGYILGYYGDHKYRVGDRVDGIYDFKYYRTPAGELIHDKGIPLYSTSGGTDAKKLLGFSNPDWVWGLNNRFAYKDFTFSFQFDGRVGGIIYNEIQGDQYQSGTSQELVEGAYGDARRAEWESFKATGTITPSYVAPGMSIAGGKPTFDANGDITNYSELSLVQNTTAVRVQNYVQFLQNKETLYTSRTFAKLREVVIGYTLPATLLSKTFIRQATISVVGRNLLYFSKSKDFDLDQFGFGNSGPPLQTGTTRRYGININLSF